MTRKTNTMSGFTVTELCIVVAVMVLLAAVAIPSVILQRRHRAQNACIQNLQIIDSVKRSWVLEKNKQNTDTPPDSDLQPYMGHGPNGSLPFCPDDPTQTFDTSYSVNNMVTKPTCKINPAKHILP
jgi:competence protein ComGC